MNNKQSRVCGPSYHPLTAMLASNRKSLALNILQKYIQKKQNSPPPTPSISFHFKIPLPPTSSSSSRSLASKQPLKYRWMMLSKVIFFFPI